MENQRTSEKSSSSFFLQKKLGFWFLILSFGVFCLVVLGGITRLTGSGLSIVRWDVITGIVPPFSFQDWQEAFSAYKTSPEFLKVNFSLSLGQFKSIYWLEYAHRLLGRLLFLVLFIPSFFILFCSHIPKSVKKVILLGIFLYLAQGGMGWYMVKSGLIQDPFVSPFRLMIHLLLALILLSLFLWQTFRFYKIVSQPLLQDLKRYKGFFLISTLLIGGTILWGALVAGFKAGLLYPTFPFMGEKFIPSEFLDLVPWYKNFLENPTTFYVMHRLFAFGSILVLWGGISTILWKKSTLWKLFMPVIICSSGQLILGAFVAYSPGALIWASLHQINAFCLWSSLLFLLCISMKNVSTCSYEGREEGNEHQQVHAA